MGFSDIMFVFKWWLVLFTIGIIFLPLTTVIFKNFFDRGYIFARILGMALISYVVFLLGILKILPFTEITILIVIFASLILNILISKYLKKNTSEEPIQSPRLSSRRAPSSAPRRWPYGLLRGGRWKIFLFEEILFLLALFFWSYIRAHEPSIHGLEKYMDFGFINSILRSQFFPPVDMWFPPFTINYYYFGHLVTAVLTKISTIPASVTYNLMLSTIFAFTFTGAFSIGANLVYSFFVILRERTERSEGARLLDRRGRSDRRISEILRFAQNDKVRIIVGGLLSGFLVSMAGNLHTIYAFFKPYVNENPVPFWQLAFSPGTFPNSYWYPNATRFIHNTIHEFPIYSAVVSDLHGHYLDVPFVLLAIALLLSIFYRFSIYTNQTQNSNIKYQISKLTTDAKRHPERSEGSGILLRLGLIRMTQSISSSFYDLRFALLLGFILAIMYMTNAWDGVIYFLLTAAVILFFQFKSAINSYNSKSIKYYVLSIMQNKKFILHTTYYILLLLIGSVLFSLPFSLNFKPFASGIGVLCAPEFLTDLGRLGPFLFEKDHCQHSPWWQLFILYGFFYFWAVSFIIFLLKKYRSVFSFQFSVFGFRFIGQSVYRSGKLKAGKQISDNREQKTDNRFSSSDIFVLILILLSTLLIIIPEFIYVKDIYPGHYRANTMFKLVYQAFIMLSLSSGYIIMRLIRPRRSYFVTPPRWPKGLLGGGHWKLGYWVIGSIGLLLVSIYPYFAINSYYGDLKKYQGLDGTAYLKPLYPNDYQAILWINKNIKGQPVILEAQGDSYTDYGRISTNTGLPTVLGWTVHEWLWRGTYDIPAPRIPEVQKMYESEDLEETKNLLKKYNVTLVFFGELERQKYPNLNEEKFKRFGKVIYQNRNTKIYEISF